jgi:glycosyltransferase involved in cell wall biosynthesis
MWPITINTFYEGAEGKALLNLKTTMIQKVKSRIGMSECLFKYKVRMLNKANIHTISPSKWLYTKVNASPVFKSSVNLHIPNGVDINVFRPMDKNKLREKYGIARDRKVILFLSANLTDKRKGFYYFANALNKMTTMNPSLIDNITTLLVGRNSKKTNMYLPTDVKNLVRTKDTSRLAEYYNIADIFISASIADNFPSTLLESLARGIPVVAFDVGGVSEIIINNKTGLLVDSKDERDLAVSIQKLLTSNDLCDKMKVACRAHVAEKFSMDMFVSNYLDVFRKSLEEKAF